MHQPSHEIQAQLAERFALSISVSQLNRVRASLDVSNPPQSAKKSELFSQGVGGGGNLVADFLPRMKQSRFPGWKEPYR